MNYPSPAVLKYYQDLLGSVIADEVVYDALNDNTREYFRHTASTIVYMSICLTCSVWQIMAAIELVWRVRKWLHFTVLFETILSFMVIFCSVLNPLTDLSCEFVISSMMISMFLHCHFNRDSGCLSFL
ncbi:uncharacterized protein B0P05DRAFT_521867 [Gilbertella persicaria]|uniref:uncharacterized protein n=1 Tax=Gilbertella persicaria TaxID=101096 RepID=UPI00221F048C|nr:uncharacterized protein B0P05DRAFT_521867 [Gilbertella persicaria]KAI8098421.1 hypothetical protein B0P05DRAFT_521867 [Gilbertella persicaria]